MKELKIDIPSIPENIRIVESFVDNAKERFNIGDDLYGNIMVSLTESVNNAILHGNQSDEKKMVHLKMTMTDDQITFLIKDSGPGFEFDNLPDPTAPENIEKVGGRGIFLMKNLCDEVKFQNNGATVELLFNIN